MGTRKIQNFRMSDIELIYFPIHGFRGLMSRLVLNLSGLKFKDTIVELKDWATTKPKTLLGYLPEIKIDGVAYAQTSPMLIYFSKQGKMDKLTELEELKSGMMLETVTEVFLGMVKPAFAIIRSPEMANADRAKQVDAFHQCVIKNSKVEFPKIEKVLKNFNCGSSVVEGKTSVGDLAVLAMHIASVYFKNEDDFKNLIPSANPLIQRLLSNPEIMPLVEEAHQIPYCPF